jgi:hypothetical protein
MWYNEDNFRVKIGGNFFVDTPSIVLYKGEDLFTIKRAESNDQLGISFTIYDQKGAKVAEVKNGQIYANDKSLYQEVKSPREYKLVERATNRIICMVVKRPVGSYVELDVTVDMYTKDGFRIKAAPDAMQFGGGLMMIGNVISRCRAAIVID